MEFSFEVDPSTDLALGVEVTFDEEVVDLEDTVHFDFSGNDPLAPTDAKPGSEDKVKMLAARYSAGVPLWNECDCYDHGPGGTSDLLDGTDDAVSALEDLDIDEE